MTAFLSGLIGGLVAWVGTTIIGQPIYKFISLRAEAARALAQYDPDEQLHYGNPVLMLADDGIVGRDGAAEAAAAIAAKDRVCDRRRDYEICGAHLIAFAASNALVTRMLQRGFRCYPKSAGEALLLLSRCQSGTPASVLARGNVISGLRLTF